MMAKQFNLEISTENAAFDQNAGAEVARILRKLADQLESNYQGMDGFKISDSNSCRVGEVFIIHSDAS